MSEDVAVQFQGVDVVWVRQRLENFIETTKPVNQSSASVLTAHTRPQCGRAEAIRQGETIRPILDRLYPQWRSENTTSRNDEFKSERDASRRLIARLDDHEEVSARLRGDDLSPRITAASLHHLVWDASSERCGPHPGRQH
ncbi:hypothetical protein ACFYT3_26005 [Nocardia amikacinitolerans]|uniref:hypothetical protein n=1 Tax=Nocardia amikacinitolerans TaxID=756689 RepID=UPI0036A8BA4B